MKVPKPILNFKTTPGPSKTQKPDSALVAPEYHHDVGARPAPDNLVVGPGPSKYHECDAAAVSQSPNPLSSGPLVLSTGPPENHVAARPAPETPLPSIGPPDQEPDAAAKPAPHSLLPSTGPPKSLELNLADAMSNGFSQPQALPTPQFSFNSTVQHTSRRNPTPRIDLRKNGAKRQHNEDTVDKARLVPQDVLMTRVVIQEKDHMIELLKKEVSG